MRIGIDLDNTTCTDRYKSGGIMLCQLKPRAKEAFELMKRKGHEIIFHTHRSEKMREATIRWLNLQGIKYDGIIFDKPHFDWYIGDEADRFVNWSFIMSKL